jgi:ketosteroid isomerase-like protein
MRFAAASLMILLGACSKEAPMPLDIAQNKQMIWDMIKAYHDAADKSDLDVIKTLMTPDVSMVMTPDDVIRGQENVLRALRDRFKSYKGTPSTLMGKELIKPDGNTALVTYVASSTSQHGIITVNCSRNKDNKWLICHIHESWSAPPK